ncbi:hypothetical protein D3C72_2440570 [compost metagenome]
MSFKSVVPESVPSVTQTSVPFIPSSAVKYTFPLYSVKFVGLLLAVGFIFLILTVPFAVPSVTQS